MPDQDANNDAEATIDDVEIKDMTRWDREMKKKMTNSAFFAALR